MRAPPSRRPRAVLFVTLALAIVVAACGDLAIPQGNSGVVIEPIDSTPAISVRAGGKPAAPQPDTSGAAIAASATEGPESSTLGATAARAGAATPASGQTASAVAAPTEGRWIDVDVTNFAVRLMERATVVRTIEPVAVGVEVDTGNFTSTQTGLFHVYNKIAGLQYDAPYDSYISDWVGFDMDKQNGFHSFLKDKDGKDTVTSTGRVSNGCIRTAAAADIFAFADIGMPVLVHV